ncbi:hypothetical protein B0J15DRAFT_61240 [Fusarium solani]|uniref:Uncharacterized protein n=1 Tax=Fusarium solani TaxID=169388 RepID=A0A9P9H102_FUSSL|nr:uncharacterized protein B0J15DRAFT_61240 [Fusarium solani]KAH7248360.1 hypothetical protein B0J15DRAFT_61240 [Fusarium solani]
MTARSSQRLTPKTQKPSKALKGLPVHECEHPKCAKTFTRAEHLRFDDTNSPMGSGGFHVVGAKRSSFARTYLSYTTITSMARQRGPGFRLSCSRDVHRLGVWRCDMCWLIQW